MHLFIRFLVLSLFLTLTQNFNVGSLNVNGASDVKKKKKSGFVFETVRVTKINVVFFQETHSDDCN